MLRLTQIKITDIVWDLDLEDGETFEDYNLPTEVLLWVDNKILNSYGVDDELSYFLSDTYEFPPKRFSYEVTDRYSITNPWLEYQGERVLV